MGKKNQQQQKTDDTGVRKTPKTSITLARKAKNVLQSNGLHHFKEWAEKPTTGGRRRRASRVSFKGDNPALYKKLVAKGEKMARKMDLGKKPKHLPKKADPVEESND